MNNTNFLEETKSILKINNRKPSDVLWIGSSDGKYAISWDIFESIANIDYDSGFGGQEIAYDIVIVGKDWWMERSEYDGAENWCFKSIPTKSKKSKIFSKVKYPGNSWLSVKEANQQGGKYPNKDE